MALQKKKFVDLVGSLEYDELIELQRDLFKGGSTIRQSISNKLKQITATESRSCVTCGNGINLRLSNEFTLTFGPPDMKKRAHFCALDCMEYFTRNLKQLTGKRLEKKQ